MPADIFQEAVIAFAAKQPVGSPWNTRQWAMVAAEVRQKSFWSAGVENVGFLAKGKSLIDDFLNERTETLPNGEVKLKVGSRADFVRKMREFQLQTGMVSSPDDFLSESDEGVRDIKLRGRLNLIFDTNTRVAWGFGRWQQGMTPLMLDAFPAWQFIRNPGSEEKRERHEQSEGEIRLKTDTKYWADFQNDPEIGGFGVPYAPFGFNSNMDVDPVRRRVAERLGLLLPGQRVVSAESRSFTDDLKASMIGIGRKLRGKLRKYLNALKRQTSQQETAMEKGLRMAKDARISAVMRSLDVARQRGHAEEVSRIAKILREEMGEDTFARKFNYRLAGDEIVFL